MGGPKKLYLTQKADGKVVAYTKRPSKIEGLLSLEIAYHGEILGVTHGGFFSVPIKETDAD